MLKKPNLEKQILLPQYQNGQPVLVTYYKARGSAIINSYDPSDQKYWCELDLPYKTKQGKLTHWAKVPSSNLRTAPSPF